MNVFTLSALLTGLSLCSGFFSLGASTVFYMSNRTGILKRVTLFILSILLINAGFTLNSLLPDDPGIIKQKEILITLFQLPGVILNIVILPHLISALLSESPGKRGQYIISFWNLSVLIQGVLYPFLSNGRPVQFSITIQMLITIIFCLIFMAVKVNEIRPLDMRKAVIQFLWISSLFFFMLIIDILISTLPLEFLYPLDNLSLPLYFFALNTGLFLFVGKILSTGPLVKEGKITETCRQNFSLTAREAEIIAVLMTDKTNQEAADSLFISKKTIENHLYSIYQKMQVKNRIQLLQKLQNWKSEI